MKKAELLMKLSAFFYAVGTPEETLSNAEPNLFLKFYAVSCFEKIDDNVSKRVITFWTYKEGEAAEKAFWHGDEPNTFLRRLQAYVKEKRDAGQIITAYRQDTNPKLRTVTMTIIFEGATPADDYVEEKHHLEYDPIIDAWTRKKIA